MALTAHASASKTHDTVLSRYKVMCIRNKLYDDNRRSKSSTSCRVLISTPALLLCLHLLTQSRSLPLIVSDSLT
jgi:hypothetical protein